ncbi:MAG TPA: amino acid adenylation domain-containing protein [Kofleriaceae bacterium]|nr:amino acid adenylation domain-containing protein [Kofleriaceae bacterium]
MAASEVVEGFRLSPQQREVLLAGDSSTAVVCARVVIDGELEVGRLERALESVVASHEILRTRFATVVGMDHPLQVTGAAPASVKVVIAEPAGSTSAEPADAAQVRCADELARPFDVERGPLLRASLTRAGAARSELFLSLSALVADLATVELLVDRLARHYASLAEVRPTDEPLQYVQFSEWQNQLEADAEAELADRTGADPAGDAELRPFLLPPQPACSDGGGRARPAIVSLAVDESLGRRLGALAAARAVPRAAVLLAAWQVVLRRIAGDDDVAVRLEANGRRFEELSDLLGRVDSTCCVRSRVQEDAPFGRAIARAALQLGDPATAARTGAVPDRRGDAVSSSAAARVAASWPSFRAQTEGPTIAADRIQFRVADRHVFAADGGLALTAIERGDAVRLDLLFDGAQRRAIDMKRLLEGWALVLEQVVERPDPAIGALAVVGADEQQELARLGRRSPPAGGLARTIDGWFEAVARRWPDRAAVTDGADGGERSVPYARLDAQANQLARVLRRHGVGRETLVGLMSGRSVELVWGLLGILKAGGAYVALDPEAPRLRLQSQLAGRDMPVMLVAPGLAAPEGFAGRVIRLDPSTTAGEEATALAGGGDPGRLAYVVFTSGSTGTPKAVSVTHENVTAYAAAIAEELSLREEEPLRFAMVSSVAADLGNTALFPALLSGGELLLLSDAATMDAIRFEDEVRRRPADVLKIVPSHFDALLAASRVPARLLPRRFLVFGGETLSLELVERIEALGSDCEIVNHYGPTETTVGALALRAVSGRCREIGCRSVPLGRPLPGVELSVLDPRGQLVPRGAAGELWIAGGGVARGYLDDAAATAERFLPARTGSGRMYRTGDQVRVLADGTFEFLGRLDRQLKINGVRVELGEIEAHVRRRPGVRDAAVVVDPDREGRPRLVAYVVPIGSSCDCEALEHALRQELPGAMVPGTWVELDGLPLTSNGKVDRRALPAPERASRRARYQPPRTTAEHTLAAIWAEVLQVERVGVHDDFFHLGGDSIQSIQISARAHRAGLAIAPRRLFQTPTIAELAADAAPADPSDGESVGAAPVADQLDFTPIQRWFLDWAADDAGSHCQVVLLELPAEASPVLIEQAIAHLARLHDSLRMILPSGARSEHAALVAPERAFSFECRDLGEGQADWRGWARETAAGLAATMDLVSGPLVRTAYLRAADGRPPLLLFVAHVLVADAVSLRILLSDLEAALAQLRAGELPHLPVPVTSAARWAACLRDHAATTAADEVGFWTAQLAAPPTALPDRPPVARSPDRGDRILEIALTLDESRAVTGEVCQTYRAQPQEVFLSALVLALAGRAGASEVRIDIAGHGREELAPGVDPSRTLGWLATRFPLRIAIGDDRRDRPGAVLAAVKDQLRRVPRSGVGFGALRYLSPDEATRSCLAAASPSEICFNYLGRIDRGSRSGLRAVREVEATPPRGRRTPYALDLRVQIADGRIEAAFVLEAGADADADADLLAHLAQEFSACMRRLIEGARRGEDAGHTPGDFPLLDADQDGLDRLLARAGRVGPIEDIYPLSPLQEGLLFHGALAPESEAYVNQRAMALVGELDRDAFAEAWRRIIARHAVLRTGFHWEQLDRPVQVVHRELALPLVSLDLRDLTGEERDRRVDELLAADRARRFAPSSAPLMRLALLRTHADRHILVWSYDHILLDGWCNKQLLEELITCHVALSRGEEPHLPPAPRYADYIGWLQRLDRGRAESFWRAELDGREGPTAPPSLPVQEQEARRARAAVGDLTLELSPEATTALTRFGRSQGLTMTTVLLGAWACVLSRWSGRRDVVFGTTVSGRPAAVAGVEQMIGLFINTIPVRARITPGQTVVAFLRELQERFAAAREHEQVPLTRIAELAGASARDPLFDTLFVHENLPAGPLVSAAVEGLRVEHLPTTDRTSYPVSVAAHPGPALSLRLSHDAARFDDLVMNRVLASLGAFVERMVAKPYAPLRDVIGLLDGERAMLRAALDPPEPEPSALSAAGGRSAPLISDRLEACCRRTPDAPAVACGDQVLSYGELDARASHIARRLARAGAGRGTVVAVLLDRRAEWLVAMLAIWKVGAVYVPIDPSLPTERIELLMEDTRATLLVRAGGPAAPRGVTIVDPTAGSAPDVGAPSSRPMTGPDDPAYIIFTSGSTGRPKGVVVPHGALSNFAEAMARAFPATAPARHVLQFFSFGFDASLAGSLISLLGGGCLFVPDDEVRSSPQAIAAYVATHAIDTAILPASLLEAIAPESVPSLTTLVSTTEGCTPAVVARWSPGRRLVNGYGPTESTIGATLAELAPGTPVHLGRPWLGMQLHLVDDDLAPVPIGVVGEILLGGAGIALGYLGQAGLTAERFLPDPFAPAARSGCRLYRTGDLARFRPDGTLEFVGRADDQVKVRGFRIELSEIEAVLRSRPEVREAVVVVREDSLGEKHLVGYVVPRDPAGCDPATLRAWLASKLPIAMVPGVLLVLPSLPVTANGKVDRAALPAIPSAADRPATPLRTELERRLARIWEEVLGVPCRSADDDFFSLGGHSLRAMAVVARIRRDLGIDLPIRCLFESPTIASLAAAVDRTPLADRTRQLPPPGPRASFMQLRFFLLQEREPTNVAYNLAVAARIEGALDVDALARSLEEIGRRHQVLRTAFVRRDRDLVPVVAERPSIRLDSFDVSGAPEDARDSLIAGHAHALADEPFDLARGPLWRAAVLRVAGDSHVVVLVMHHIVADEWSRGVLLRELAALYAALHRGAPSPLPPLRRQYADFAAAQEAFLAGETAVVQLDYWRGLLSDLPPRPVLPAGPAAAPAPDRPAASRTPVQLSATTAAALASLARAERATTTMVLLAAYRALLFELTGQTDILIGTPATRRAHPDFEPLIGCFVNTLVHRVRADVDRPFRALLRQTRDASIDAQAHQDIPFETLIEELRPERHPDEPPWFSAWFGFHEREELPGETDGLRITPLDVGRAGRLHAKYPINLDLGEVETGIAGFLEHRQDLWTLKEAARAASSFAFLCDAIARNPDAPVRGLAGAAARVEREAAEERRARMRERHRASLERRRRGRST